MKFEMNRQSLVSERTINYPADQSAYTNMRNYGTSEYDKNYGSSDRGGNALWTENVKGSFAHAN